MVPNPRTPVCADRLRSLNLPQPVHVLFADEDTDNRIPTAVAYDHTSWKRVESIGEVWQVDDEWWRDRIARRYLDVVLQGGAHVALFEDLTTHAWFVQSI